MRFDPRSLRVLGVWLSVGALLGVGCRTAPPVPGIRLLYFGVPSAEDPWTTKIAAWQSREQAERSDADGPDSPAAVAGSGDALPPVGPPASDLRAKYQMFRAERKRELARELAAWIQGQAKEHYVPDGPVDHWATLEETLDTNGDDCDGLELLVFHLLRDLGFEREEVFRAIVHRPSDGQHHMVTLWFEDPDDPWVIDPTGAMTRGMPRLSDVEGWTPLKLFTEEAEYTVRTARSATATMRERRR